MSIYDGLALIGPSGKEPGLPTKCLGNDRSEAKCEWQRWINQMDKRVSSVGPDPCERFRRVVPLTICFYRVQVAEEAGIRAAGGPFFYALDLLPTI